MKKQFFLMGAVVILGFAACNDNDTASTTKTDSLTTNAGDTTIQTTTTTTTTTKTVHPIANFEHRTFYNVATHKPVKLRMDTVLHYYVDVTTNKEPDYYYYDPAAKDTFDYWGRVLNNALIMNNGAYTVDETRLSTETTTEPTATTTVDTAKMDNNSKMKMKQKDDKTKIKTKEK